MTDSEEDIEQLSMKDGEIIQASSKTFLTHGRGRLDYSMSTETAELPPRNKGVTRVVACVAICFLLVCFGLVGVSLLMSKNIDSIDWINIILSELIFQNTFDYARRDLKTKVAAMRSMLVITYNHSFDEVNSDDDFDKIEVLSSHIENSDEFFLAPVTNLSDQEIEDLDRKERERKRIARVVALVAGILFLVSVALVTVSLYMAKDIDEMVRNSNEMLRKHNDRMSEVQTNIDGNTTSLS